MAAHAPTLLGTAPPFFRAYMDAQRRHGDDPLYPAVRACCGGGAPIPPEVHREVREVLGVAIVGSFGLTEYPMVTSAEPDDPPEVLAHTVGRASPGVRTRVVDGAGVVLPEGSEGELQLLGPQAMLGYVDAALDADAFADGWFRTGDLAFVDAGGRIHITGRLKDVIIRNAENISALEVEGVLLRHPDVVDVGVVGVPDPRTGERVCAVVVPTPGTSPTVESLLAHCVAEGLARQKCPERVELVAELPRNAMGKILKQELRRDLVAAS
jgi:acyl-CoA synthetase (AMP-forming)/AMP-acid ligase II